VGQSEPQGQRIDPKLRELLEPAPRDPHMRQRLVTAVLGITGVLILVHKVMNQPNKLIQFAMIIAGCVLLYIGETRRLNGLAWGGRLGLFGAFMIFPAVFYIWWPLTVLVLLSFAWVHFSDVHS
jgi:hypothetical protein